MPPERTEEQVQSPEHATTPAETFPVQDHSWTVQQLYHLSKDVGALNEAVNTLKSTVAGHQKTLNHIMITIAVATGAGLVIGYIFDRRFDQIMDALK